MEPEVEDLERIEEEKAAKLGTEGAATRAKEVPKDQAVLVPGCILLSRCCSIAIFPSAE